MHMQHLLLYLNLSSVDTVHSYTRLALPLTWDLGGRIFELERKILFCLVIFGDKPGDNEVLYCRDLSTGGLQLRSNANEDVLHCRATGLCLRTTRCLHHCRFCSIEEKSFCQERWQCQRYYRCVSVLYSLLRTAYIAHFAPVEVFLMMLAGRPPSFDAFL
jgi:hypothetical protein